MPLNLRKKKKSNDQHTGELTAIAANEVRLKEKERRRMDQAIKMLPPGKTK